MLSYSPLLCLPPELRLQIYDAVLVLPVDFDVRNQPAQATPGALLPVPWLSLMLVCKTIAHELQHHVQTSTNTMYELKVDCSRRLATTWRQIPCPPSRARSLQVELCLGWNTRFWGDGGPMPILSALYQVLNCFIHNGPFLDRRSPLDKHIHLDALIVVLRVDEPDAEARRVQGREPYDQEMVDRWKKVLRRGLKQYISLVVGQGVLSGAVDRIVCQSADDDDGDVTKWDVHRKTIGDMTEWNLYHFNWGVPGSSSLEASGVLPA
ncbi:hypothetical protein B0H14DRAFT_2602316 [Mycena olivaceomarginata]|nr:hypothetical protein B0H14DRAFT_2602316 [Mycena olivaceomarginata]